MSLEVKYQTPYMIRLRDGTECMAMLIHFNPKYHGKAPVPDMWKRLDNVPKKKRYVDKSDVVAIAAWRKKNEEEV